MKHDLSALCTPHTHVGNNAECSYHSIYTEKNMAMGFRWTPFSFHMGITWVSHEYHMGIKCQVHVNIPSYFLNRLHQSIYKPVLLGLGGCGLIAFLDIWGCGLMLVLIMCGWGLTLFLPICDCGWGLSVVLGADGGCIRLGELTPCWWGLWYEAWSPGMGTLTGMEVWYWPGIGCWVLENNA